MQNLVLNQHGVYTFRYYSSGKSIRVSLKTKDALDAKRTYYKVQQALLEHAHLSVRETKLLINAVIQEARDLDPKRIRRELLHSLSESLFDQDDLSVTEAFEKFVNEKQRSGSWRQASEVLARDHFSELIEILGDVPIRTVREQEALLVKEALQQLPKHPKKKRQYKLLPIAELVKMNIPSYQKD